MWTHAIALMLTAAIFGQATLAGDADRVLAGVEGPTQGTLATYRGHVGHRTVRYNADLSTGATTFRLVHWVDVDEAHAPKVLPLEGLIGLSRPTQQNWYASGFIRLYVGDEQIGESPVKSVRVNEDGARGAVAFDWKRDEGTWRVTFVALPMGKSLLCSIRHFPAAEPVQWRLQLLNFPAGATRDGEREIATSKRTVTQTSKAQLAPADEYWVTYYDNAHDAGTRKSEGPSALLYVPEDVRTCEVQVGVYPVTTVVQPAGNEVRMAFWDSFFGMKNAEAVAYMRRTADAQLAALRTTTFVHRSVFADDWRQTANEMQSLLENLGQPADETRQATDLNDRIAQRVERLRETPGKAGPDDDAALVRELAEQKKLLWHLRWEELFKE